MSTNPPKDFPTSPPAATSDAETAAALVTNAAFAMSVRGSETQRRASDHHSRVALTHPHPDVRMSAIAALSRTGSFTPVDFQNLLSDTSSNVRRRAVEAAVGLIQSTDAEMEALVVPLVKALTDEATVAEVAGFALGEFGPGRESSTEPAVSALEEVARHHANALCRESAVAALGALHRGRETVLAALGDKATVRRRAVLALAPFSGTDVDAALKSALGDRDWQVRQAAEDQTAARTV